MMNSIIRLDKINKSYGHHVIYQDYCLDIKENDIVVIMGASGRGKTTLLNIIGFIESIDSGKIFLYEKEIHKKDIRSIHKEKIGFLFQNFALLEEKTVLYNLEIVFPSLKERKKNKKKIYELLEDVGLNGYEKKRVCECSGGEKQRIAIARLLLHNSDIILADEPTGSLDKENRDLIMDIFVRLKKKGKTIVIVTHDEKLKEIADVVITI